MVNQAVIQDILLFLLRVSPFSLSSRSCMKLNTFKTSIKCSNNFKVVLGTCLQTEVQINVTSRPGSVYFVKLLVSWFNRHSYLKKIGAGLRHMTTLVVSSIQLRVNAPAGLYNRLRSVTAVLKQRDTAERSLYNPTENDESMNLSNNP